MYQYLNYSVKAPVPDTIPPTTHVDPVCNTPPPNTSNNKLVAVCHGVKWYDYKTLIDLDKVPSIQWKFTNQFGDTVYS